VSAQVAVLQLVRAHYRGDNMGFASAAQALARKASTPSVKAEIQELIRRGFLGRGPAGAMGGAQPERYGLDKPQAPARQLQPLPPVQATPEGPLHLLPRLTFEDLLLDPAIQLELDNVVTELEYRAELATRGLRARNRFLFHGPPGNGKTSVSAALGHALGVDAYCVSIAELISSYHGGTGAALGRMFANIRDGMVVVLDEVDAIGGDRNDSQSTERNSTLNVLLQELDKNRSGVICATTNRLEALDPALLRRFDERILFPEPTIEQIASLTARLCDKFKIDLLDASDCRNFDEVTKRVEREARRVVMRELIEADSANTDDETQPPIN
jgi:SpoVK/Ycf46/Vps4 family AAA+-type ATPase